MPGRACKASEPLLNIRGIQQAPAQGGEAGDDVSSMDKIGAFSKSSTPCVKIIVGCGLTVDLGQFRSKRSSQTIFSCALLP